MATRGTRYTSLHPPLQPSADHAEGRLGLLEILQIMLHHGVLGIQLPADVLAVALLGHRQRHDPRVLARQLLDARVVVLGGEQEIHHAPDHLGGGACRGMGGAGGGRSGGLVWGSMG